MASPQRENGHVDVANELIESLMKTHLSGREWQIIMVLFRQTWGYCDLKNGKPYRDKSGLLVKKKLDRISHSQFEKFTGINRRKIWGILNDLLEKNIIIKTITKKGDITVCNYGIQKDSNKWVLSPKKGIVKTITKKGDRLSPKKGIGSITKKGAHKRKLTKETIQKKRGNIFLKAWKDFKDMRKKNNKGKPMTTRAEGMILNKLCKLSTNEKEQINILNESTMNDWKGVYPLKENQKEGDFEYPEYVPKKISKEEKERFLNVAKKGLKKFKGAINNPQRFRESGDKK